MSGFSNQLFALLSLILIIRCTPVEEKFEFEEGTKRINQADIYYKIMGSGEPLIVVHGGPGLNHSYLSPWMEQLADDYQLIFYDHRCSGRSSLEVPPATISLRGFVEDIEGLRQLLKLDSINLLAHSWGGLIAMNYALAYPQQLRSLILVSSVGASTEHRDTLSQLFSSRMTPSDSADHARVINSTAFREHQADAYEELYKVIFRKDFYQRGLVDSLQLDFQDNFHQSSLLLRNLSPDLRYYNYYTDLQQVLTPTLMIYGDHDPLFQLVAPRLLSNLPNARLEVIHRCGHFPFIEAPGEFLETTRQFLDNL